MTTPADDDSAAAKRALRVRFVAARDGLGELRPERRRVRLYLSLINWGEVLYIVRREKGEVAGHEVAARIDALPITLRGVDRALVQGAATLKAQYPIAYADAFAAATAQLLKVPVVTGDPEFRRLEAVIEILWTQEPSAPS